MNRWRVLKLFEICDVRDGTHDSPKQALEGYPLVTSKHLNRGRINYHDAYLISQKDYVSINKRSQVDKWDILISMIGTVGDVALVKKEPQFSIKNVGLIKNNGDEVLAKYLYYFLSSPSTQKYISQTLTGSTQKFISLSQLRNFPINLPDFLTQQKITNILSTYDDLIEANEKRIKILEEMAQRLYTEWFVHFRFPGHEKIKLVDSHTSFGMIPDGWEVKKLNEVARAVRGCSYSSREISDQDGTYNLVNLKNVNKGGGFRSGGTKYFSGRAKPEQLLFHGDIVIAVTDMTPDRAIVGRPARIPTLEGKITFSADLVKIVSSHLPNSFLYYLLVDKRFTETTKIKANGANVLHLSPLSMLDYPLVKPIDSVLLRYSEKTTPLLEEMDKLTSTNTHLQTARDLLIPQLVSGKREVK